MKPIKVNVPECEIQHIITKIKVLDREGKPVKGLKPGDFSSEYFRVVREQADGVYLVRPIRDFIVYV